MPEGWPLAWPNVDWDFHGVEDTDEGQDGMQVDDPSDGSNGLCVPEMTIRDLNQQEEAIRDGLIGYPGVERRQKLSDGIRAALQPTKPTVASHGLPGLWSQGPVLEEACQELDIPNQAPYYVKGTPSSNTLYWHQVKAVAHMKRCLPAFKKVVILDSAGLGKTRATLMGTEQALHKSAGKKVKKPSLIVVPSGAVGEPWISEGLARTNSPTLQWATALGENTRTRGASSIGMLEIVERFSIARTVSPLSSARMTR